MRNYREKHQLLLDLESFELSKLCCESKFDQDFIYSAVELWYGSRESFTQFVREPLRQELLDMMPRPHLPRGYAALIMTVGVSFLLDAIIGFFHAFPGMEVLIFSISWGSYLLCCVPVGWNLFFCLCDWLADGHGVVGSAKTLFVTAAIVAWNLLGMGLSIFAGRAETCQRLGMLSRSFKLSFQ